MKPNNTKTVWVFIGRTDVEAQTPILWPPDAKSWLIWKDLDAGKDWRQEEKGTTEDEMVGWHHRLSAHEFEWSPRDGDGQGGLACCNSWGHKELDTTEWLNWTGIIFKFFNRIWTNFGNFYHWTIIVTLQNSYNTCNWQCDFENKIQFMKRPYKVFDIEEACYIYLWKWYLKVIGADIDKVTL